MLIWLLLTACSVTPEGSTDKYDFVNLWMEIVEAPSIVEEYEGTCGRFRDDGVFHLIVDGEPEVFGYCIDEDLLIQIDEVTLAVTSDDGVHWDALASWNGLTSDGLLRLSCDDEQWLEPLTLCEARFLLACP